MREINITSRLKDYDFLIIWIAASLSIFFIGSPIALLLLTVWTLYLCVRCDINTLFFFMIFQLIQNLYLIIFASNLNANDTKIIIILKELLIYIPCINYLFKKGIDSFCGKIEKALLIGYLVFTIIGIYIASAPLNVVVSSLRQVLLPFFCIFFGFHFNAHSYDINIIMNKYLDYAIVFGLVGLIIYWQPIEIWDDMGYKQYLLNKNSTIKDIYDSFVSKDFGFSVKRFVSSTADPVATAHILGFIVLFLFVCEKNMYFFKILLCICLILCISKSALFLLMTSSLIILYFKLKNKILQKIFIIGGIVGMIIMIYYAQLYVNNLEENTASGNHLKSLFYAFNNNTIFGNGLGSAGYNALLSGGEVNTESMESFFAVLVAQTGILSAICFYGFMFMKIRRLFIKYYQSKSSFILFSLIIFTDVVLESFVSGSSVSMLGTALYFIFAGIGLSNNNVLISNINE